MGSVSWSPETPGQWLLHDYRDGDDGDYGDDGEDDDGDDGDDDDVDGQTYFVTSPYPLRHPNDILLKTPRNPKDSPENPEDVMQGVAFLLISNRCTRSISS